MKLTVLGPKMRLTKLYFLWMTLITKIRLRSESCFYLNEIQDSAASWFDFDGQLFSAGNDPSSSERFQNFYLDGGGSRGNYVVFETESGNGYWYEVTDDESFDIVCYKPATSSEYIVTVSDCISF